MKILTKLEKKKATWFLIAICTIFFLLRLPSLIEPHWYGDEGIYQVISLAMNSGWNLYADVWDNKPPLLYVMYAIFSGDQFTIRLISLFFGIASVLAFFFLSQKLLQSNKPAMIATSAFTLLFATPYLEGNIANAENFMLPLILTAGLLIFSYANVHTSIPKLKEKYLIGAGHLLGIAFLFKIVAIFDLAAFSLFLVLILLSKETLHKRHALHKNILKLFMHSFLTVRPIVIGFIVPILITFIYFTFQGTLLAFIQAAFFGNVSYVGYNNNLIIPQGFLILKLVVFAMALTLLFTYREVFPKSVLFIMLWFVFALFSAFFSQRPYTHYLLVILPSFCLLLGLFFTKQNVFARVRIGLVLFALVVVAVNYFHVYGVEKSIKYYRNTFAFLNGQQSVKEYQSFFDSETPRDYELVSYINNHTTPSDEVFIWGDSPQIYYLAKKLPPGRYTVSYHIIQDPNGVKETQAAIDKTQPKFIITLSEAPPIPFDLRSYAGTYGIQGAAIYERTY